MCCQQSTENDHEKEFSLLVTDSVIEYLKQIHKEKNFLLFHKVLDKMFGEYMCNDEFLKWLANKLQIQP